MAISSYREWYDRHLWADVIALLLSAVAFGMWMASAAAGVWWFFSAFVVEVLIDTRPTTQAYLEYRRRELAYAADAVDPSEDSNTGKPTTRVK